MPARTAGKSNRPGEGGGIFRKRSDMNGKTLRIGLPETALAHLCGKILAVAKMSGFVGVVSNGISGSLSKKRAFDEPDAN